MYGVISNGGLYHAINIGMGSVDMESWAYTSLASHTRANNNVDVGSSKIQLSWQRVFLYC